MDGSKFFRVSEVHDADFIADRLREIDIKEIKAISGGTALENLLKGYYISDECNTIIIDKRPAGMFGVTPDYMTGGIIWMLATPHIKDISITFLRQSKKWVDKKCGEYSVLYNYVAAENTIAINWLRFLGFNFKEHVDMRGMEFIRFERSA